MGTIMEYLPNLGELSNHSEDAKLYVLVSTSIHF